jgi:hypothetical protein
MTHLSDEAIAAFADGVLHGLARERALRHTKVCAECHHAVTVQREAVWALRAAPAPALPNGLLDRLRGLPQNIPITAALPSAMSSDGGAMFSVMAPVAAFVPSEAAPRVKHGTQRRLRPVLGTAAALAVAGAVVAGSTSGVTTGHPSHPAPPVPANLVGFRAPR